MAAVTHADARASTTDGANANSNAFTPATDDLLVVFVHASDTTAAGTLVGSLGLTFTRITSVLRGTTHTLYAFVANALATNASQTVQFQTGGADDLSGATIFVARVSGMTRTGSSAVRQFKTLTGGGAGAPSITFDANCLTGNPTFGFVGVNQSAPTFTEPTGWTERGETGHSTPNSGGEYVSRDSGFTGATMTWAGASGTAHAIIALELDSTAPSSAKPWLYRPVTQTLVAAAHLAGSVASAIPLTHLMGIGAPADTSVRYRARANEAATLSIEYSTNSDLSSSTTSSGVAVVSGDDFTGGETISGLSANTLYYYSILVNGARAHSAPFPTFRTFPTAGAAADMVVAFGSCMTTPTEPDIFASIAAESPTLFLHLGDFGYPDSTTLTNQRTNYKTQYASDFLTNIVRKTPRAHIWDDHDYGGDNEDGDLSAKANSLKVFKEYLPLHDLANASNGIWRSFVMGDAEFFLLDTRYQREGSKQRFPASSTNTADTGSTGTSLVLRAADSPSGSDDTYNSWYVEVEGVVRRITDYVAATRTCALNASVPGLSSSSIYYLRRASMLDMDGIADDQVDWLIAGVNGSTKRWKVICSSVVWNPTFTGTGSGDSWGGWDTDQIERKFLFQEITADNVLVLSGDRHASGVDDGTNAGWPEASASPFNRSNISVGGSWTHGTFNSGLAYGLVTFDASDGTAILTVKNKNGTTASGISPLTVTAV